MAFQPVPFTVGVEIRGTLLGQDVENTFYYLYTGTMTEARLEELTEAVGAAVIVQWLADLPEGWVGREVYARDLSTEFAVQATDTAISGEVGVLSGQTMPAFNTVAIARRSGLTGRSARGRIFWMGLSESVVSGNTLTAGTAAAFIADVEAIDAVAISLGYEPVIVSRYTNGAKRATATTFALTDWLVVDSAVDTRRSRKGS